MMIGIQLVGILFGLFMLYITFLHNKRKELNLNEGIFWVIAWVIFICLVIFPNSLDFIARGALGISRTLDFLIILGFMFLIGISFYNYMIIKKNKKNIEMVVRHLAIERPKEKFK